MTAGAASRRRRKGTERLPKTGPPFSSGMIPVPLLLLLLMGRVRPFSPWQPLPPRLHRRCGVTTIFSTAEKRSAAAASGTGSKIVSVPPPPPPGAAAGAVNGESNGRVEIPFRISTGEGVDIASARVPPSPSSPSLRQPDAMKRAEDNAPENGAVAHGIPTPDDAVEEKPEGSDKNSHRPVESARLKKARQLLADLTGSDDVQQPTVQRTTEAPRPTPPRKSSAAGASAPPKWSSSRFANGAKVATPTLQYDPRRSASALLFQPAKWIRRNVEIAFPLFAWGCGVLLDSTTSGTRKEDATKLRTRARARQLLTIITGLGPAIIKAGQALSSRPDLLPSEYLEELQKLQDDVPRFDDSVAFRTVERELGRRFGDVFVLVGDGPVAAASIGQVYRATLVETGEEVALKVQRPDCEGIVSLDLYVLRWWSGIANVFAGLLGRDIDVQSIIDDFGELIYRELDYVAEAANADRFMELYGGVDDVFVPKVYEELTTSKVLTMDWVEGYRLTDTSSLDANGLDREKLIDTLVQCSLRQILENGFFHADPHGGNVLATPDGRLCYLDFGMMSYANVRQRNGFLLAVIHMVNRDWGEIVSLYQRLGFIPESTDLGEIEVALEGALPDVLNADVSELNFKNVINSLGDIMYKYPFSLPPFYISIIRCLGVLEGLAIQVDPNFRVINDAYPYIASRLLTDSEPEMQEALRRLALTSDGKIRWNRLEDLLENANSSTGYDITIALNLLTDYLLSEDGEPLLDDLAEQLVDGADTLGVEIVEYAAQVARSLLLGDEVSAVRTLRAVQEFLAQRLEEGGIKGGPGGKGHDPAAADNNGAPSPSLEDIMPEPTPSIRRLWKVVSLLGGGEGGDPGALLLSADASKFVPIVQKIAKDVRIQSIIVEVFAQLGERALSRALRATFGLPAPTF